MHVGAKSCHFAKFASLTGTISYNVVSTVHVHGVVLESLCVVFFCRKLVSTRCIFQLTADFGALQFLDAVRELTNFVSFAHPAGWQSTRVVDPRLFESTRLTWCVLQKLMSAHISPCNVRRRWKRGPGSNCENLNQSILNSDVFIFSFVYFCQPHARPLSKQETKINKIKRERLMAN